MVARRRPAVPRNRKADHQKNVRDPSEHPLGTTQGPGATDRRRAVSGDDHMRLPFEHDETSDAQERAGGTDRVIEQAADDVRSDRVDTDRRADAVDNFNRQSRTQRRR